MNVYNPFPRRSDGKLYTLVKLYLLWLGYRWFKWISRVPGIDDL